MWYKVYAKAVVATAAALAVATAVVADGEVSVGDWLAIASAFVGALGVARVPNASGGE